MAPRFAARWPAAQGSVLFAFSQHLRTNRRAKSCAYWFDMLGYSQYGSLKLSMNLFITDLQSKRKSYVAPPGLVVYP
jgi:hypothetical protein